MNVLRATAQFQIDTGPVLLPDFAASAPREIERFDIAYVLYHLFDRAEFIVRKPVAIVPGAPDAVLTDYSVTRTVAARSTIVAAG
jgi:hypothetical protein